MKIEINIDLYEEEEKYATVPNHFTEEDIEDFLNADDQYRGWYSWAKL